MPSESLASLVNGHGLLELSDGEARPYSHTFSVSVQRPCRAGSRAPAVRKARLYGS